MEEITDPDKLPPGVKKILLVDLSLFSEEKMIMKPGTPTHSVDIDGNVICLGDLVGYDYPDNTSFFNIVFEGNAFRKKYKKWDKELPYPILEYGEVAKSLRLKIKKKWRNPVYYEFPDGGDVLLSDAEKIFYTPPSLQEGRGRIQLVEAVKTIEEIRAKGIEKKELDPELKHAFVN